MFWLSDSSFTQRHLCLIGVLFVIFISKVASVTYPGNKLIERVFTEFPSFSYDI